MPLYRRFVCALLVSVALLVPACAGDDDDDGAATLTDSPTGSTSTPTATSTAEPTPAPTPTSSPSPTVAPADLADYELSATWGAPVIPQYPSDLALLDDGALAVADLGRGEIQIFSADGELEDRWSIEDPAGARPNTPASIAYGNDSFYATFWATDSLVRFNMEGGLLAESDTRFSSTVSDVEVGPDGNVYAVHARGRFGWGRSGTQIPFGIYVYDQDLNQVEVWETPPMLIPVAIAFDDDGIAHVLLFSLNEPEGGALESEPALIARIDPANYDPAVWDDTAALDIKGQFDGLAFDVEGRYVLVEQAGPDSRDSDVTTLHVVNRDGEFEHSWQVAFRIGLRSAEVAAGIVAGDDGAIYLADPANNRVITFDGAGNETGEISRAGDGLFAEPVGIAADPNGALYIADAGTSEVLRFDASGELQRATDFPLIPDPIRNRVDIAVAASGDAHIVAEAALPERSWIRVPPEGNALTIEVDEYFDMRSRFIFEPITIAVGPDGLFYLGMQLDKRVRSYTAEGETVADWPATDDTNLAAVIDVAAGPDGVFALHLGKQDGADVILLHDITSDETEPLAVFNPSSDVEVDGAVEAYPYDLALGPEGGFYLLDPRAEEVVLLDAEGAEVGRLDLDERVQRSFASLAVDAQGRIYVTDMYQREVLVYAPLDA